MSKELTGLELARACADQMLADDQTSRSLGMQIRIIEPGTAEVRMKIEPSMVNGHDVCHGGFIFSVADSAFAFACNCYDEVTVAASASIDYIAPARLGNELVAIAKEFHRGRRIGVYEVEVRDQNERIIALFRGRSVGLGRPILGKK